jgi:hypothetical protein
LHEEEESEAPEKEYDADKDDLLKVHQLADGVLKGESGKIHENIH